MGKVALREVGAPSPVGSSIRDKWVEYKGKRVTEVPTGEEFTIYVSITAKNPGNGPLDPWEAMCTCLSSDGKIATYDRNEGLGDTISEDGMKLDSKPSGFTNPTMPATDITLYFKLWGNDSIYQDIPPIDDWVD